MKNYISSDSAQFISLGQPLFMGAPHYPTHPPYLHALTRLHGEGTGNYGVREGASDSISMGTHVGTHVDSVFHISDDGKFYGGICTNEPGVQSYADGITVKGIPNLKPIVGRGVLLDFTRLEGTEIVPHDYAITPERVNRCLSLEGVALVPGDVVLIRTGWDLLWDQPGQFVAAKLPGPVHETAQFFVSQGIAATGSDTIAYELYPHHLEVHGELLVKHGVPIMECLNLQELAEHQVYEFQFIGLPLNINGATGSPINPIAFF